DVGATRFLNRCPGHVGRYLGLTGARLQAADAVYCGLATHFVTQDRIDPLVADLAATEPHREPVGEILDRYARTPGQAPLATLQPAIDRCFADDRVEAILEALAAEPAISGATADWAAQARASLLTKSPTSLKITLRQLTIGREYDLEAALTLEYRLSQHVMAAHDFYEGIRAVLIDRDQQPHWRPPTLAEVGEDTVNAYFAPLGERELRFA
ncbi:MAG: enoyl-CoA hydratase/isomerase family protein, partial [Alphaproteobacteria bacterium]|nr:enoyl-CoA hydratase/isomerase family protein [Alphaproteobacteria bacterium]